MIEIEKDRLVPQIAMASRDFRKPLVQLMIDTGAEPNIIKASAVKGSSMVNEEESILVSGITDGKVRTIGSVEIDILGFPVTFQIVKENFPIESDGILGADFYTGQAIISYVHNALLWKDNCVPFSNVACVAVPPRTNIGVRVAIVNTCKEQGIIPVMDLHPGILFGGAVVKNIEGHAYTRIINTSDALVELMIPAIVLEDFNEKHVIAIAPVDGDPQHAQVGHATHTAAQPPTAAFTTSDSPCLEPVERYGKHTTESPALGSGDDRGVRKQPDSKHRKILHARAHKRVPDTQATKTVNKSSANARGQTSHSDNPSSSNSTRYNALLDALRLEHLNDEEKENILELIDQNSDLFHLPNEPLTMTNAVTHKIPTTDEIPVHVKQYRYPHVHKEEIERQIDDLFKKRIIRPSSSPYNSPLWIVPKKNDSLGRKKWRMVIDYRKLNEKSLADAYPLPNITEVLDQLGSAKYFSVLDLASGFHQIPVDEKDAPKTAFSTPHGHYEFVRMPFGLKNGPATFQRLMDNVLTGLQGNELFVYLDDIVIYASSLIDHNAKFNKLAERLRKANLRLQPDKCEFLRKEVTYLGHIIGEDGVRPDPGKVKAVREFPRPRNATNIKQFLGLAGYYRRFIAKFSYITKPLTNLLKKDTEFVWTDKHENAFNKIKDVLCTEPLLQFPDFSKPFVLTTDASGYAIGGILSQGPIGEDLPIAYTSRVLNKAECNYSTIEKECLALVYCTMHFRPYLYGRKFTLVTDHKPLVWINSIKDPTSRVARWRTRLEDYTYDIVYKAGKKNVNADALSRNPVIDSEEHKVLPITSDSDEPIFDPPSIPTIPTDDTRPRSSYETPIDVSSSPISSPDTVPRAERAIPSSPTTISTDISMPSTSRQTEVIPMEVSDELPDEDDTSSTDESLFQTPASPYRVRDPKIIEIRDKITMRTDNLAFFLTMQGEPCDTGSRELATANRLPKFVDLTLGRAKVMRAGSKHYVGLVVAETLHSPIDKGILKEAIDSLFDVSNELQLETISIAKTYIGNIEWSTIKTLLKSRFTSTFTNIIVCQGVIVTPPPDEWEGIMKENHCSAVGGHKGVTKTYARIRERYFWPRMKIHIQQFIQKCSSCQLNKLTRLKTKQPLVLTDTPGESFDKIAMDVVGPLPSSPSGNVYILTIQDLLTKYSLAIPLKTVTAVDIADAFINKFICRFGSPKTVLTDQGSNFINSLMRTVAKKFKITQCKTTAFHPQSNGSIERSHHVLIEYLKHYIENNNWDEWLPLATFSYNTSVHEGTRHTPHELVFGKRARLPSSSPLESDTQDPTYIDYLFELQKKLATLQENAHTNLEEAKDRTKKYYDRRMRAHEYKAGDYVYLLKEPRKSKFDAQYTGPYRIIANLGNQNVKISIKGRAKVVHTNKLKLCKSRE